jgi:dipeptidyl aminopeptidase/acylaminoacyl peptidase
MPKHYTDSRPATRIFTSLLILLAAIPLAYASGNQPIVTTDLLRIKQPLSIHYSPDGTQILYVLRTITDDEENSGQYRYDNQLHLMPADGSGEARQLTFGRHGAAQPDWSPDGSRIAFVRNAGDKPQIFVLTLGGGEARQLTHIESGAGNPKWSPDGRRILFTTSVGYRSIGGHGLLPEPAHKWDFEKPVLEKPFRSGDTRPDPDGTMDEIRAWLRENEDNLNPNVINRLNFLSERGLQAEITFSHLLTIASDGSEEPVAVTRGYQSYAAGEWSPDGTRIVFTGARYTNIHPDRSELSSIFIANTDGSATETLISIDDYSVFNPAFSPDGRYISFLASNRSDRGYAQTQAGIFDTRNQSYRLISSELDRSAGNLKWSDNGRYIYIVAPTNGGFPVYRYDLNRSDWRKLGDHETGIQDYTLRGNSIAYVLTEASNPFEIYTARDDMSRPRRLSELNTGWLANKRLSLPEKHTITTSDGFEIEYWIMKPAFYEDAQRYPLLVQIHGGPSAMWGPGEASMWHEFQLFAAMGYGIVYSNPRGSGGYGRDFQHGNHQDWGFGPMNDVLAAAGMAEELPWTDQDRMFVTGGSYGGYLVAWIVAHDHRFRAAAAQRGVYELTTFMGEGNAWRLIPDRFGGYPWEPEIREILFRESPYSWVDQIETPLLILHGDVDLRTGVSQSEMLYKSLKILEKPVEYVRYPGADHELSRSGNVVQRFDRLLRMIEFFERYRQGD